jgi:hypothetical protein
MIVAAVTALCVLVGLMFLLLARRRFRRHRFGSCALHGTSSLVFFLAAACAALLGFDLLSYDRLTREQPALEARFSRVGDEQFDVELTYPSGATQRYALRGDDWQVDARVLKWRGAANVLGFDTAYRLERIAGRYADIDRERAATRTVYALNPPQRVDVWTLLRRFHQYLPWVDTLYGSAAFMPMADGARYEVKVSQTGLVARPLNLAAQQAVGAWH